MDKQTQILLAAMLGVGLVVLAILLQPAIEEQLAPEIQTAWVAIEAEGSGVAEVASLEIPNTASFRLYAVLEAVDGDGPLYYTEAKALRIDGRDVPAKRLRTWNRPLRVTVRWFTVEGTPPYLEIGSAEDLERWHFEELYRPDWPLTWSIPGLLDPAKDDHLTADSAASYDFGIQRYHVLFELYGAVDEMKPRQSYRSWSAEDLRLEHERYPTVRRVLPGKLAPVSRVFGLTQLEVVAAAEDSGTRQLTEIRRKIGELARQGLAFSRATVLRDQIEAAGKSFDELAWRDVDVVEGKNRWGEIADPGDLLRVGERVVVLYRDEGEPGLLDYQDLCLDFVHGAAVRPLSGVFSGDGVVELAPLGVIPQDP